MIQCKACHYIAPGLTELAEHIHTVHGFSQQKAMGEAARVAGVDTDDTTRAALRQERIDILAGMVQDLRMRLAAAEGENVRLRAEKHELAAHVLRLFGEDERPSLAIRALVLRARAALEGNTQ